MGKIIGIVLMLGGIAGILYQWIMLQKARQLRLEEFILFLQKSIFAMETERVKVIDYFAKYVSCDSEITESLREIAKRLGQNTYPKGQEAWEEVLKEEEQNWAFDKESFDVVLHAGNGFFGRSREENICFLQKSLREMEKLQAKIKEKDAQERKVWVPVGMLGGVMIMILLI